MNMDFNVTSLSAYGRGTDTAVIYCWHISADRPTTGRRGQQIVTKKYGKMKNPQEKSAAGRHWQLFMQHL